MKKLMLIAVLMACCCQGCTTFRPNTQKGHHLDEINTHRQRINDLDPVIYKVNARVLPMQAEQTADVMSFQARMQAKIKAMRERE